MASTARTAPLSMTREQRIFLLLLVLSICINYIDRGSLGVAGRLLETDLRIDHITFGKLLSAFFWTYATFQVVAGWLVDRYNVNWVYAAGFLLWSVATMLTGFVGSIGALLMFRLMLGIGESVAYPSYSRILSRNFREDQRGLANALVDAGSKAGPAIGVLLGGLLMGRFGWRYFFVAMGIASLIWLLPWAIFAPRDLQTREDRALLKPPSVARILKQRDAWGTFIGLLSCNYVWYFMVLWLPSYFREARHYTQQDLGLFGQIPYWGVAAASLTGGWLSDRWIRAGASCTRARKTFVVGGLTIASLMLPASLIQDSRISLALLTVACLGFGFYTSNLWAITQTLSGPRAAGKWTGLQNMFGNIPGIFGPWFTGWIVQTTGSYVMAFASCIVFLALGVVAYLGVIGRLEEIDWN